LGSLSPVKLSIFLRKPFLVITDLLTIPPQGPGPISDPRDRVHHHAPLISHELIVGLFPEIVNHVCIQD
jgi:hypothetical protein